MTLLPMAPLDSLYDKIPILSNTELLSAFKEKPLLVVGGTRGVGRGISLELGTAGADITIGRSIASGEKY